MTLTRRQAISTLGASALSAPCLSAGGVSAAVTWANASTPVESASDFLRAVREGDLPRVRRLLAKNAALASSVDAEGRSAFAWAHLSGHVGVASELRRTGLELDIVEAVLAEDWQRVEALAKSDPRFLNASHPVGGTPVYAAALVGSLGFWRLRSLGCDPDARPKGGSGFSPARGAMDSARESWARIAATDLLANGADPNAPQRDGDSVLHGAVRRRSEVLVRLAIRKGADVGAVDAEGRTPKQLAAQIGWRAGEGLLAGQASLPRDNRSSRFALDANRQPIERPDLSDVPQEMQSQVTANSHMRLKRVRELVSKDARLIFSISTDDELAIEASAHLGNRPLMRFHLDHGAPLSLPTAVSLGDLASVKFWLKRDPTLAHERGAHDFPVMWFALLGRGGPEMAELLVDHGVPVDQESMGTTTLHQCVNRNDRALASWLIEKGADIEAVGFKWNRDGQTPLQLARAKKRDAMAKLLVAAGAKR